MCGPHCRNLGILLTVGCPGAANTLPADQNVSKVQRLRILGQIPLLGESNLRHFGQCLNQKLEKDRKLEHLIMSGPSYYLL